MNLDAPSFFVPRRETIRPPAAPRFEWLGAVVGGAVIPDPPAGAPVDLAEKFNLAVAAQDFKALVDIAASAPAAALPAGSTALGTYGNELFQAIMQSGKCRQLPAEEIPTVTAEAKKVDPSAPNPLKAVIDIIVGTHPGFAQLNTPADFDNAIQILTNSANTLRSAGAPKTATLFDLRRGFIQDVKNGQLQPAAAKHAQIMKELCPSGTQVSPGQPTGSTPTPAHIEQLLSQAPAFKSVVEDAFKTGEPGSLRVIADSAAAAGQTALADALRAEATKLEAAKAAPPTEAKKTNWLPVIVGVIVVGGVVVAIAAGAGD
jgi:hypothetical protein